MDYEAQAAEVAEAVGEAALADAPGDEAVEAHAVRLRILVDGAEIKPLNWLFQVPNRNLVTNTFNNAVKLKWKGIDARSPADEQGIWALAHVTACSCGNCGFCREQIDTYVMEVFRWYVTLGEKYNKDLRVDSPLKDLEHVIYFMFIAFRICQNNFSFLKNANPTESANQTILNAVNDLLWNLIDGNWAGHNVCHSAVIRMAIHAITCCSDQFRFGSGVLAKCILWIRDELNGESPNQNWFIRFANRRYKTIIVTLKWMLDHLFHSTPVSVLLAGNYDSVVHAIYEVGLTILTIIFQGVPFLFKAKNCPISRNEYEKYATAICSNLKEILELSSVLQEVFCGKAVVLTSGQPLVDYCWPTQNGATFAANVNNLVQFLSTRPDPYQIHQILTNFAQEIPLIFRPNNMGRKSQEEQEILYLINSALHAGANTLSIAIDRASNDERAILFRKERAIIYLKNGRLP